MRRTSTLARVPVAAAAVLALSALLAPAASAQTVTNVRAQQLADRTVEVLYDLSGAATGGATVAIAFSSDGGATYAITPTSATLSGNVGAGIASGTNRRIVWNAAGQLAAGTYGTNYKAAVTATNPGSGGPEVTVTLAGGVPLVMVKVPAGTFQMGSPTTDSWADSDEMPQHQVTLTTDYYMGKYLVTQGQWKAVMGTNPSYFSSCGDSCPVEQVSWNDIRGTGGFVEKLNTYLTSTGQAGAGKFRLPTEAEWERAARGGTTTRFSFGDAAGCDSGCGACSLADQYMWWCGNESRPHLVGAKLPNQHALFDMHGNVWEWVDDWYGAYPSSAQTNPTGPTTGSVGLGRGGDVNGGLRYSRSASREQYGHGDRFRFLGFRLARSL